MQTQSMLGPYRIDEMLGQGGMATVYKVWHSGLHRYEALKLLPPQMTHDKSFVERFLGEARTAANLHHANIATIHTVSDADSAQPYFTMELVEGGDLARLISEQRIFSLDGALPILRQIAAAIDYAHSKGVIHRDVKPANILLQEDGTGWSVKVVDFGIARALEQSEGARLTRTGMIVGTPEYMSPEQGGSGAKVDRRTDVYSFGIIAYEMLCGRPPFVLAGDASPISVIMNHIQEQPPAPTLLAPGLSPRAGAAVLKALAKSPDDRFSSCSDFVKALATGSTPVQDHRPKPKPSNPAPAIIVAVCVIGLALIALGFWRSQQANPTPQSTVTPNGPSNSTPMITAPATPPPSAPAKVAVPDVVGIKEDQASELLGSKSLKMHVTKAHSDSVESGRVISESPSAGELINADGTVAINISEGPMQTESIDPQWHAAADEGITQTLNTWQSAWLRKDIDPYMSVYAPDAHIYTNHRWFDYSGYYADERQKFMDGGLVSRHLGVPRITVLSQDAATVSLTLDYCRVGGVGNYTSSGFETFKMRRDGATWLIYEDVFHRN